MAHNDHDKPYRVDERSPLMTTTLTLYHNEDNTSLTEFAFETWEWGDVKVWTATWVDWDENTPYPVVYLSRDAAVLSTLTNMANDVWEQIVDEMHYTELGEDDVLSYLAELPDARVALRADGDEARVDFQSSTVYLAPVALIPPTYRGY